MNNGKVKEFDLNLASEAFGMIRLGDVLIAPAAIAAMRTTDTSEIEIELLSGSKYTFHETYALQFQEWLEARKAEAQRARMNPALDPRQLIIDASKLRR